VTFIVSLNPITFPSGDADCHLGATGVGAVAQFEKATLVAELAAARKRMATGEKIEGRKSHVDTRLDLVKLAKALAHKKPKGGKLNLRAISAELKVS
jgi:hypothetical protein